MSHSPKSIDEVRQLLLQGLVIPAHPLALTAESKLDERRQRALSRYYLSAGAGGLAVGVHTTQFAIREPQFDLLKPVLELAQEVAAEFSTEQPLMIAGICGRTPQAVREAELAVSLGYDAGLLSLAAWPDGDDEELLVHCRQVAAVIPLVGFYLQPAVGGRRLSSEFWNRLCEISEVVAIKVAPFNRYQTLDVIHAVSRSGRASEIALLTGNDDSIVIDLLTEYRLDGELGSLPLRFHGGLLGHWACWTRAAVRLFEQIQAACDDTVQASTLIDLMTIAHQVTDMNAAIFDAAHNYRGCIAGIHEVLRRQGLLAGIWCLDPHEKLSPDQADEITRVCHSYPHLIDDDFVKEGLASWLQ